METLRADLRTRHRQEVGAKEKGRRGKRKVKFSLVEENTTFQKSCMKVGERVKKLLRAGMAPTGTWRAQIVGMSPTDSFKLKVQMAATTRKKKTTSLSLFSEAFGVEMEEELFQTWACTHLKAGDASIKIWEESRSEKVNTKPTGAWKGKRMARLRAQTAAARKVGLCGKEREEQGIKQSGVPLLTSADV